MSLFNPKTSSDADLASLSIELLECSICGRRFSPSVIYNFPFCEAGIDHKLMSSNEQKLSLEKLQATTGEPSTRVFLHKFKRLEF